MDTIREALETQATSSKPDRGVIKGALEKLSTLAGGVLASYIANKYQIPIDHLLAMASGGILP